MMPLLTWVAISATAVCLLNRQTRATLPQKRSLPPARNPTFTTATWKASPVTYLMKKSYRILSSEVYTFTEANAAIRSLNVDADREQHTLTFRIPVKPPDYAVVRLTSPYGLPMHETVVSLLSPVTPSSLCQIESKHFRNMPSTPQKR